MSRNAAAVQRALGPEGLAGKASATPATGLPVEPLSAYTELIAKLLVGPERGRVVAFTSALPREGVTYTVKRLAAELERNTGLRAATANIAEMRSAPLSQGARVLGGRLAPPSSETEEWLPTLRRDFDFVFVDAGSLADGAAILTLASTVDAVIIVVEAGRTRKEEVDKTVASVLAAQGKIAGFVLNKHRRWIPAWLEKLVNQ